MKEYIRINQLAYDALYEEYDRRATQKGGFEQSAEAFCSSVLRHVDPTRKDISVLEVGPGSGEVLLCFEQKGCRTVAVDISAKILQVAQRRSPRTIFILGDIGEIEFTCDQFDVVYAGALIHLFPLDDALGLLAKFRRWLRAGGVLFVNTTIHTQTEEGYFTKSDYGVTVTRYRRKWTEQELLQALAACNYSIAERLYTDERDRMKQWVGFVCTKEAKSGPIP